MESPTGARLEEAFKGLRELNRKEHDWLGRDIEDLRRDFMALRERMAEYEPRIDVLAAAQASTERQASARSNNWPQWVTAAAALLAALIALWGTQHPPTPDTATLVAALETYQQEHKR